MPPNFGKVTIGAALITFCGAVLAALISGYFLLQSVELSRQTQANATAITQRGQTKATEIAQVSPPPLPTYTLAPTYTPYTTPLLPTSYPTSTPYPTATSVPTAMPIPPSTPFPDTPPDSILAVGQIWRQGGAEVVLKNVRVGGPYITGVHFAIYFTNRKPYDISFKYDVENNIMAVDNRGRSLKVGHYGETARYRFCPEQIDVPSGQTVQLHCSNTYSITAETDVGDPAITEVVITVFGISSINNARWRIPIPR